MPRPMNRRRALCALASAGLGLQATGVRAQSTFPDRPVTLIVPFPAGGSTDRHLRTLAEIASRHLGQSIIVDNRPGAGGTLAPAQMARTARPDGYTICQFPMSMLRLPQMQKTSWDPLRDFTYIIGLSGYTFGLVVRADSPYSSFKAYADAARANPHSLNYGSTGTGSSPHLLMEDLSTAAGIQVNHVPFKGNADLTQALLGGHVMAQCDAVGWDRYVDGGQARLLMTFGEGRTRRWPQVATARELGYDVMGNSPYGLAGPRGMDPLVVRSLHDAFREASLSARNQDVLEQLAQDAWYCDGQAYAAWARETHASSRVLLERLGLLAP